MLRNGVMPIPPARNTAVRVTSLWRVRLPDGPSILTAEPSGIVFNTRLNAVSRIRVATIRVSSSGPLAIENVRVFPSASVSGGSHRVISRDWPASNVQFDGFSKRNAVVRSATSCLLTSLDRVTGEAVVAIMSLLPVVHLPEAAFQAAGLADSLRGANNRTSLPKVISTCRPLELLSA